jgi:hypothetical protein
MENLEDDLEIGEVTSDELYKLALTAFSDIWDNPVNDHWDEFLKE